MNQTLYEQVENVIEHNIRPLLKEHNGDIRIKSIEDKIVRVVFLGACKSCPSAQITIEDVVKKILKNELKDEIEEVFLINDISEDMLSFAKQILK